MCGPLEYPGGICDISRRIRCVLRCVSKFKNTAIQPHTLPTGTTSILGFLCQKQPVKNQGLHPSSTSVFKTIADLGDSIVHMSSMTLCFLVHFYLIKKWRISWDDHCLQVLPDDHLLQVLSDDHCLQVLSGDHCLQVFSGDHCLWASLMTIAFRSSLMTIAYRSSLVTIAFRSFMVTIAFRSSLVTIAFR